MRHNLLKQLLQSPQWTEAEKLADEMIQGWKEQSNLADTEWETAKNAALEEGQIRGVRNFIQRIHNEAINDKS